MTSLIPTRLRKILARGKRWTRGIPGRFEAWRYGLPEIEPDFLFRNRPRPHFKPITDDCYMPPYRGSSHNDLEFLLTLGHQLDPAIVLELGTAYGNTVANLCLACTTARILTVNALPEQISGEHVTEVLAQEDIGRVYRDAGFAERVTQIFANTLDLALDEYSEPNSIDMAIIDACHDTDFVIHDFELVAPFVRPDGFVLLHDTHPSMERHLGSSYRACMALRREGYDIRHVRGTWWAVWKKQDHAETGSKFFETRTRSKGPNKTARSLSSMSSFR